MSYKIELRPAASRQLAKLSPSIQSRIGRAIDLLADDPRPHGSKKLQNTSLYRVRAGSHRIIYTIEDDILLVLVVSVGDRKQVYQRLKDIKKTLH